MTDRNPQSAQMEDESMIRTLAAQARCIWPQERSLLERYGQPREVLDLGCGTGEISLRLAQHYPSSRILGVDLVPSHLAIARAKTAHLGPRVTFQQGDAFELELEDASQDLVLCRHLLQAVPQPHLVVQECLRVLRPGAWIHLLVEDYTMIHIAGLPPELDRFWHDGPVSYGQHTGCDLRIGRRGPELLKGLEALRQDYVVVDTLRCRREDLAGVWAAWRDGYTEVLVEHSGWSRSEIADAWEVMIQQILTGYALWQVPIVSARKPS